MRDSEDKDKAKVRNPKQEHNTEPSSPVCYINSKGIRKEYKEDGSKEKVKGRKDSRS